MLKKILTTLSLLTPLLTAADLYVSPSGNNTNPGTLASPWKTLTHATTQLTSGDTLHLRAGTYPERLIITNLNNLTIRPYLTESPIIDGATLTVPNSGNREGLLKIQNSNNINIQGLEIKNYSTSNKDITPAGIQIEGSGSGIKISNCHVHTIHQNSTNQDANGFGIAIYGTSTTPIDGLILENNEVNNLRTGQSESIVLNGNVTNFIIRKNEVHHCNNIGIDFIGYENSAPAAVDRARNGICTENYCHHIDSAFNPGYGGNFTTGGGDQSAAGIYIDGSTNIIVSRNRVTECNFGIELASEHPSGTTDHITLINNLLHHNYGPGIIMGGYDSQRGKTTHCIVRNNTLYLNDTRLTYSGQIALQFYLENNQFLNNILWANPSSNQMIIHYVEGGTAAKRAFSNTNSFDYNLYFTTGSELDEIEFGLNPTGSNNTSYNSLTSWKSIINGEANSLVTNPNFSTPAHTTTPSPEDFTLTETSPAKDKGQPSPTFTPIPNEKDLSGKSRTANNRVDIGCHEFMSKLQTWRDQHFQLPDGQTPAGNNEDPDHDNILNLIEYSQGMNPTLADVHLAPSITLNQNSLNFLYKKSAPELTYQVKTSTDLVSWLNNTAPEQNTSGTQFSTTLPIQPAPIQLFLKLLVSE